MPVKRLSKKQNPAAAIEPAASKIKSGSQEGEQRRFRVAHPKINARSRNEKQQKRRNARALQNKISCGGLANVHKLAARLIFLPFCLDSGERRLVGQLQARI